MSENLVRLSDLAVQAAMAGYLVALVCHAVETASKFARKPAPVERELAAVGAGSGAGSAGSAGMTPSSAPGDVGRPQAANGSDADERGGDSGDGPAARHTSGDHHTLGEQVGAAAVIVTAIGFACQVIALVLRGFAADRGPWGDMYEFTLMIVGAAVGAWLVALWRTDGARAMGIYVMTPVTVLMFLAGTVLYTASTPVEPILHSYWLNIHVLLISLSSGVLMLSGLTSAAYLVRVRHDARVAAGMTADDTVLARCKRALATRFGKGDAASGGAASGSTASRSAASGSARVATAPPLPTKLPAADKLDRIAYRAAIAAFPFFTFAIIAGALWAEVAWGKYWSWDPKEVCALVSWVIYAGYLHARATAGWRGKPAAWISVVGLASILFNLFFINMVVSGLHSYAGLN